tara:strand:- start:280 stop:1110 length:831 start_codon:yes stop_codon:yes gene_type:complete
MKKKYLLTLLFIILFFKIKAQEVEIRPVLFSTKELKLSVDLGMDFNWANKNEASSLMKLNGETTGKNIKFNTIPSATGGLGFDIYSPFSVIGFYFGVNYNRHEFSIHNNSNQVIDSINTKNLEVPIYLKFRFGKVQSKSHLVVGLGGGYSIPLSTELKSFNNNISIYESKDEKLYKATPFLSSIIGYEFLVPFSGSKGREMYDRDDFRILLYAKGNYDLGNRINPDMSFSNKSSLSNINNPDIQFSQISFGLKIFMRLSKLGNLSKDGLIQHLKNN